MITKAQVPESYKNTIIGIFQEQGVTPFSIEAAAYGVIFPSLSQENGIELNEFTEEGKKIAVKEYRTNTKGYATVALEIYGDFLTVEFQKSIEPFIKSLPEALQKELDTKAKAKSAEVTADYITRFIPSDYTETDGYCEVHDTVHGDVFPQASPEEEEVLALFGALGLR